MGRGRSGRRGAAHTARGQRTDLEAGLLDLLAADLAGAVRTLVHLLECAVDLAHAVPGGIDLAEELRCDPSTISRTVADKYMQTPRGFYPLRYFFTGGTQTDEGESVGWDRVKTRVRELVEAEDKKKPLNDDQIAARLKKEGIEMSRRTVAKYRQQLDIPAARQRKQF